MTVKDGVTIGKDVPDYAAEIARRIHKVAGGGLRVERRIDFVGVPVQLSWHCNCPCGETSGFGMLIDALISGSIEAFVGYNVDIALHAMRRHVKEEGNEPNF